MQRPQKRNDAANRGSRDGTDDEQGFLCGSCVEECVESRALTVKTKHRGVGKDSAGTEVTDPRAVESHVKRNRSQRRVPIRSTAKRAEKGFFAPRVVFAKRKKLANHSSLQFISYLEPFFASRLAVVVVRNPKRLSLRLFVRPLSFRRQAQLVFPHQHRAKRLFPQIAGPCYVVCLLVTARDGFGSLAMRRCHARLLRLELLHTFSRLS